MPVDARTDNYALAYDDGNAESAPVERYYPAPVAGGSGGGGGGIEVGGGTSGTVEAFGGQLLAVHSLVTYLSGVPFTTGQTDFPPQQVAAVDNGDLTARISWQPPDSGTPTGYEVARDGTDSNGAGAYTEVVGVDVRSFRFTKLVAQSTYNLKVTALYGTRRSSTVTVSVKIGDPLTTTTYQLAPTEDAFTSQSTATSNRNGDAKLRTDDTVRSYLKFSLTGVTGTLTAASLTVTTLADTTGDSQSLYLVIDDTWAETTITWDTQPALGTLLGTIGGAKAATTAYTFTIDPALLQPEVGGTLSVAMAQTGTNGVDFGDRLSTTPPSLVLSTKSATDRTTLVPGTYIPDATTTGPLPNTALKVASATNVPAGCTVQESGNTLRIATAGTVLDGWDLPYKIDVRAGTVTIKNSIVRGMKTWSLDANGNVANSACILAIDAAVAGLVVEDVRIVPQTPRYNINGVMGHDYIARRCDVYNIVDGFSVFNTHSPGTAVNVTIEANWTHDPAFWNVPSVVHSDLKSHNDAVQIQGGLGVGVRGNRFDCFYGTAGDVPPADKTQHVLAALMFNANVGATGGHNVVENWINGANVPVNMLGTNLSGLNMGTMHRNTFDGKSFALTNPPQTIYRRSDVALDAGSNTANANLFASGAEVMVRVLAV